MADKLMYIPHDDTENTYSVYQNGWFKRLNTQINNPTNQNSLMSLKLLIQRIRKLWGLV